MSAEIELHSGPAPHFQTKITVSRAMLDLLTALVPLSMVSLYIFGGGALLVMVTCISGALLGEVVARRLKGEEASLQDGTALATGLLLALTLPPTAWWAVVPLYTFGGFLATAVFREAVGGLGRNRFNPALMSRVFLLMGRTTLVYGAPLLLQISPVFEPWLIDLEVIDAVSKATPLMMLSEGLSPPSLRSLLLVFEGGALAETSVLATGIGAAYLLYLGHIEWRIPVSMILSVFVLTLLFGGMPVHQILSGGLLFGAFFMATDWVTRPVTGRGKLIFGTGIGMLVVFFRLVLAGYWVPVGGVAFSILIMNAFVERIDRLTKRDKYGAVESS